MAMINDSQILFQTTKRVVIKITGQGAPDDAGNLAANTLSFTGFKSVNGNIGRVTIKSVNYSISGNSTVKLYWYGVAGNANAVFLAGSGVFPDPSSDGITISAPASINATGNIWVSTQGFNNSNAGYTLILDLHKDATYYDPGTSLDPAAFNR